MKKPIDALTIISRLRDGEVTIKQIMAEYGCGYDKLMDAIFDKISMDDWKEIRRQQYKRSSARAWVTRRKLIL